MRAVVQRVLNAGVTVDGECVGKIGRGYLVLLGVGHGDTRAEADKLWGKLRGLRINEDENGKTNLALADVDGEMLVVSQFTLFADCRHGRRPSFTDAGAPDVANELYEYFLTLVRQDVEHGHPPPRSWTRRNQSLWSLSDGVSPLTDPKPQA